MPELLNEQQKIFVVLNPMAGSCIAADVRQTLEQYFEGRCEIYETTGSENENVTEVTREALAHGFDMVVAIGGDGTVSDVAEALIGTDIPLGIIAAGTANVFARELELPLDLAGACTMLAGQHATTSVDAMQVGDKYFVLQIGIGIDSLMIRDTDRQAKRRFGRAAYLWTAFTRLIGNQPERFTIVVDGQRSRLTQAALETLAVIAYRQPVTRARVSAIRGVGVDGVMRTLISRGLVHEVGTDPDSGGGLYETTPLFLERLGLAGLAELPELAPLLPEPSSLLDEHPDR